MDGGPNIEALSRGDAYLCIEGRRTWFKDGFWPLGALVRDDRDTIACIGGGEYARTLWENSFQRQRDAVLKYIPHVGNADCRYR